MRTVHLIRHGATEASRLRLYYGSSDIPLSEDAGEELLALKKKGIYPPADGCRVFTTGMLRTVQTLSILYPGVAAQSVPELREMDFGSFELRGYEELKDDPEYQNWISGNYLENVCPGGESAKNHGLRSFDGLTKVLKSTDKDVIIICHGGTITCLMERLFPDDGPNRWFWDCKTGRGFSVLFNGDYPLAWKKI